MDNPLTIVLIGLLIILICLAVFQKYKGKNKMRYTCGIEGGCFATPHGTYTSRKECEKKCGKKIIDLQDNYI